MFSDKKIILASQSPRRSQLLREAGFKFEVRAKEVEETYPDTLKVEDVAAYLAQKKAKASSELLDNKTIILAADSVVIIDDTIYNKPTDYADGVRMLQDLSGRMHRVITGVCLLSEEKELVFSGISNVFLDVITDEEIDFYLNTYQPYDKAGAYGVQEWLGLCKINKIEGTYANVMGLPVQLVYQHLINF